MKPNFLLFCFILVILTFTSCAKKSLKETLLGKWKVSETVITRDKNTPTGFSDLIMEEMSSSIYEFKENGKFILKSIRIKDGVEGVWRLNESEDELYYEYEINGLTYKSTYPIEMINDNSFIIRQDFGSGLGKIKVTLNRIP